MWKTEKIKPYMVGTAMYKDGNRLGTRKRNKVFKDGITDAIQNPSAWFLAGRQSRKSISRRRQLGV